jgi:hypothetical protein
MLRRFAAFLAVLAVVLGACGSPSAPALTDPKDILSKTALSITNIKTSHVQIDLSGKINVDLTGSGNASPLDLTGTTATIDSDITGGKVHATFSAPALFGAAGELIAADNAAYYKLTGPLAQFSAPDGKYTKVAIPDLSSIASQIEPSPAASVMPSLNPQQIADQINAALAKLPTPPVKAADEKVGDQDCYRVTIHLTAADIATLSSPEPVASDAPSDITVDIWTRKSDLRPAKFAIGLTMPQGTLTITVTATYDQALTITAPAADQVVEGSLPFPVPSSAP